MEAQTMISRENVPLVATVLILGVAALGCDVTNPGNILDQDLDNPEAMPALVNGMASDFAQALAGHGGNNCTIGGCGGALLGNALYGDLFGSSSERGGLFFARLGELPESRPELSNALTEIHQSRWVAESGIDRMQDVLGDQFQSSPLAAEAYLWAGFSNRLGGDTFCRAVFDGGGFQPRVAWYERAEQQFSQAVQIAESAGATDLAHAAYGGRASVRIQLGDWQGALSDASEVPTDFSWAAPFGSTQQGNRRTNALWKEMGDRVNLSVAYTWFRDYYMESGDPRVPSDSAGRVAADGETPLVAQRKFPTGGSDIPVTKGAEMRLIEAEYEITQTGDWEEGMAIINDLRSRAGVDSAQASNQQEAFEALIRERGIVLWLEGRRGGDYFRWDLEPENDPILSTMAANAEAAGASVQLQDRATCFQISRETREANPNLPPTGGG